LTAESPSPHLPFHRPAAYFETARPRTTMRPTSASSREDIATRTRRKWGQRARGESMVAARDRRSAAPTAVCPVCDCVPRSKLLP
jgi:hypothetical protein